MHKMRVFHMNASDASHELLEDMLRGESNIHVLGHSPSVAGGFEEMKRCFPDVVILDESACSGPAADDVQKLLTHSPYLAVLVTTSEDTSAKRRQLMNAGARDVLSKPYPAEELVESLRSVYGYIRPLRDHYAGHSTRLLIRAPKMITVFGTKGGIGKSTLSSMLASGLSYRFREDTALVDLDLQFGDISVMMDILPQSTLTHAVENIEKLTGRELRQLMTKHPLQLYILPSPQNPEEADFISEPALIKIFSLLKEQFDYVVVDCPPGFTESSVVALERSDCILFVTSPELISLRNTKTGLKTMLDLGIDESKIKVVVNRHSPKSHFTKGMIEDILGVPVYKFLSNDYPHVLKSINQEPFCDGFTERTNIPCELTEFGAERPLPRYLGISLMRIVAECFQWIAPSGGTQQVSVRIRWRRRGVSLRIVTDGVVWEHGKMTEEKTAMEQRASIVGGAIRWSKNDVTMSFPDGVEVR